MDKIEEKKFQDDFKAVGFIASDQDWENMKNNPFVLIEFLLLKINELENRLKLLEQIK